MEAAELAESIAHLGLAEHEKTCTNACFCIPIYNGDLDVASPNRLAEAHFIM